MENAVNFVLYRLVVDNSRPHRFRVKFVSPSIADIVGFQTP